jgi:hypothetical protein
MHFAKPWIVAVVALAIGAAGLAGFAIGRRGAKRVLGADSLAAGGGGRIARRDLRVAVGVCVLVFAALTALRRKYLSNVATWDEVVRDLAIAFCPIAVSLLIVDFWLRRSRREEVHELLEHEVARILAAPLARVRALGAAGLLRVHPHLSSEDLLQFIGRAERTIRVLVPWFVDPLAWRPILRNKAQNPDFHLQITILHPHSTFVRRRGEVLQPNQQNYGPTEGGRSLLALAEALVGTPAYGQNGGGGNAEVRVYDSLPSAFIVQRDEVALLGFHFNTGPALQNPQLEVALAFEGSPTPLGRAIQEELDKVAQPSFSRRVDLKSVKQIAGNLTFDTIDA